MKQPLGKVLKWSFEFKIQHKPMDSFPKRSLVISRRLEIMHIESPNKLNKPVRVMHTPLLLSDEYGGPEVI